VSSHGFYDRKLCKRRILNKNRPRIRDIADELNLSPSTVSRALANDSRISQQVRDAVTDLAKKWGYIRNPFAFNLHKRTSNHIGLVLPEFTHHFFSQALKGIDAVINEGGYHLIINTHNDDYLRERRAVSALNGLLVEGMLVAYAGDNDGFQQYKDVISNGVPVVFFDRSCEEIEGSYVVTDDFGGAISAIDHLVKTGCKKIAYFSGPEDISTNFNRQMGYLEGLKKNGVAITKDLILPWQGDSENWKKSITAFLRSHRPDGIFCFSDYIAYDTLCSLEALNVRVPEEVSIIGFAGEPVSEFSRPKISTVQQPAELIGRRAAEILLWHLAHPEDKKIITELIPTQLILRGTTR
jgi:DNA-binding LacI/PurR family transcriptional regulator